MSELIIVRHSQSTHNRDRIWAGWHDPTLTEAGRSDAWRAGAHWKHHDIHAITSSDLRRAAEGAAILAEALDTPLLPADPRWRERNAGEWQGVPLTQVEGDPRYHTWKHDPTLTPPGGEDWNTFTSRLHEAIHDHLNDTEHGRTLTVTHDGVMQAVSRTLDVDGHPCGPLRDSIRITRTGGKLTATAHHTRTPDTNCDICRIAREARQPGHLHLTTRNHNISSYLGSPGEVERPGWIIVSPNRHVTRWHQLTTEERDELGDICQTIDTALTLHTGARRVMVASLGWATDAHLHVHCVPTFDPQVTEGYLNFDGRYRRSPHIPDDLHDTLTSTLEHRLRHLLT